MKPLVRLAVAAGCLIVGASGALADPITKIASGVEHACALTAAGGVLCWGDNTIGQLGNGMTGTYESAPVWPGGLETGAVAVTAGASHSCALTSGGGAKCWGWNYDGQLGDGTTTDQPTPKAVYGLSGAIAVSAGLMHTCAVTSGGGVVCWGYNVDGELGDNSTTGHITPMPVIGLSGTVTAIAAGGYHTCALTSGGGVECWGSNGYGQLGDNSTQDRWTPVPVTGLSSSVVAIATGTFHTCALKAGGTVDCWGANLSGQLGDNTTDDHLTPMPVSGLAGGATAIDAAFMHTCAVTANGGLACWGLNLDGQLGDGTQEDRLTPAAVVALPGAMTSSSGGDYHTCAVAAAGGVLCWGYNGHGQLGDGTITGHSTPAAVSGLIGAPVRSDYTGNRKSDLLWQHTVQRDMWLWDMNGTAPASQPYVSTVSSTYAVLATGDFTGDGKADLLWRHVTQGDLWLWAMDGSARLAEVYVATVDPSYVVAGTGDFDGDGRADLLWRGAAGDMWMWLMYGATSLDEQYVATVSTAYTIKGTADLDGDHKADLLWQGTAGDLWAWLMNGAAQKSSGYVGTVGASYGVQEVADFDGDGKADILWRGVAAGDMWLWKMNGAGVSAGEYAGLVDTSYAIIAAGDYDGDTKTDLLWRGAAGDLWIWLMNGPAEKASDYAGTVADTGYQVITK